MAEKVASQVIDLVETNINAPIVIDDNEIGDIVRNSFNEVIADFLPVTTSTQSSCVKRHANIQRPENWRDIVQHYGVYKKGAKTIRKYKLELLHSSHDYWLATFGKWKKQAANSLYVPYKGRASIIGKLVESELVRVVERYSTHGVPMTNYIVRCNLMALLVKHECNDVLKQVEDGEHEESGCGLNHQLR